jgi:Fe-S-cluster containining protein
VSGFDLGPIRLAACWRPLLHPRIAALEFPALPDIHCDDCRMVRHGMFAADTRCCDYVPPLPNFLAGEILSEGQADGSRDRVETWVAQGRGDPLFVNTPPRLAASHRERRQPCPLLDADTRCTIYEHRPYLCVGYNCIYPRDPKVVGLWNSLSSLLALHSAVTAQFLIAELGIDGARYTDAWDAAGPEQEQWTGEDGLRPDLLSELWQGETDPAGFYRRCFEYVVTYADIRARVEAFRRAQLVRRGLRSAEEITAISLEPEPLEPPRAARTVLENRIMVFAEHHWTVVEHESFLLWYHSRSAAQQG